MEKYPHARDEEFKTAVRKLILKPNSAVLDIPAGGGYLASYLLNKNVHYLGYDFSGEFDDNHTGIRKCKEASIDLEKNSVDEVVSLAALHHISEREAFYSEMYRVLKPGGQLIIGDVASGSKLEYFLNGFLDSWNSMGHQGKFLKESDIIELRQSGFRVDKQEEVYAWRFANANEAMDYFRLLFCLDLNPTDRELLKALKNLGVKEENGFSVSWGLTFLICQK